MKAGCCCPQSPNCATVCAVHPGSFCLPPLGWELGGELQHPRLSASCSRMTETLSQGTQAGLWGGRGKTLGCVVSCSCPTESQLRCPGRGTKEAEMSQRLQEEKEPECVSVCVWPPHALPASWGGLSLKCTQIRLAPELGRPRSWASDHPCT